jgi:hypothetical protein
LFLEAFFALVECRHVVPVAFSSIIMSEIGASASGSCSG